MIARPRVLVIASTFPRWGGDTEPGFIHSLSRELSANFDITVLAPHHGKARMFEVMDGLEVVRFPYFIPGLQRLCYDGGIHENLKRSFAARFQLPFFVVFEFLAMARLLFRGRYSLVHAHWIIPHGFLAVVARLFFRVPVVVSSHAGDVFPLRNPLLRLAARWVLRRANAVTANSTATMAAIKSVVDVPVSVIPMGVDLRLFSSSSASSAAAIRKKYGVKGKLLLFVGRLAEKKGVSFLVSAMLSVVKHYPGCKLVVVGDGPERPALQVQVQQLGLSGSVVFAGSVSNRQLPPYYGAADVFVLPSIVDRKGDTEGLGVVLLEAIAAGCPVVASNVGGIPDIIIDGKTGILVEQKNAGELSAAIVRLLGSSGLREKLSAAAMSRVAKSYSWGKVGRDFSSLLGRHCRK